MNIKNIKHYLLGLGFSLGMTTVITGCSDFLDVLPVNDVVLENYWDQEKRRDQRTDGLL
jgi:hypothetical protein